MFNVRTDLAIEAAALYNKPKSELDNIDGVEIYNSDEKDYKVTRIKITNENGAKTLGKLKGNYITIECPKINESDDDVFNNVSNAVSRELKSLLKINKNQTVLVVGLGNWNVTPDALGPKVVSNLMVTRHLFDYIPDKLPKDIQPLCAISPGVLGITGIETSEIIKGITDKIKPDVIIAIDALASRKIERISSTIQIADTGITPGSGIGNKRKGLNKDYLGVDVIAIGVPTVVDAATVANDTIELISENIKNSTELDKDIGNLIGLMNDDMRYPLIKEVLNPYIGDLIVTPKEVDTIIDDVSKVIANGINLAVHNDAQNMKS